MGRNGTWVYGSHTTVMLAQVVPGWSPGQQNLQHLIETRVMRPRPGPAVSASQGWATCVCACVGVYECV